MAMMIQVLFRYLVHNTFEDYSSNYARTGTAWHDTIFFSEVGLRKFVLASELFVLRPYLICHLTAKRSTKILWLSSIYSSKKVVKTAIKEENLEIHMFIVNFSKKGCH